MVRLNNISIGLQTVKEIRDTISLQVHGRLPSYLEQNTLYRVGPGVYDVKHSDGKPYKIGHWFDGLSLLHAFHIDASTNSVSYRNRSLTDGLVRTIEATPRNKWPEISFGTTDPCRSLLGRFFQLWTPTPIDPQTGRPPAQNVGVTVQQDVGGKGLVIRTDTSTGIALEEDTLEIDHFFNYEKFNNSLKGIMSAAHGHLDRKTGEFFNYVYDLHGIGATTYSIFKIRPDGSTNTLAKISEHPVYIHSFATTDNYIVLILWPFFINQLKILWHRNFLDSCSFREDVDARFIVVSRHGDGVIATYSSPAFFCFHTVNAFERNDDIHIDLCRYEDAKVLHEFKFPTMCTAKDFSLATLTRFTLPSISSAAESSQRPYDTQRSAQVHKFDEHFLELPRIHPDMKQKDYSFVYGMSSEEGLLNAVAKVDVNTGKRIVWSEEDAVVGEPIFVPDPAGNEEDDGCLLVVVLDAKQKKSSLVVLDAKSMKKIASAQVPQIVPLGFHGIIHHQEAAA